MIGRANRHAGRRPTIHDFTARRREKSWMPTEACHRALDPLVGMTRTAPTVCGHDEDGAVVCGHDGHGAVVCGHGEDSTVRPHRYSAALLERVIPEAHHHNVLVGRRLAADAREYVAAQVSVPCAPNCIVP